MNITSVIDSSFLRLNAAWFCLYLALCVIHSVILAKSPAYHVVIHEAWFEHLVIINPYSSIAFIMNLAVMRRYCFRFNKSKLLSIMVYLPLMFILSQAWFWFSVPPSFFTYLASGGMPG